MSLSLYLKNSRESAGLTQREVARALKVRPQFISSWERGTSKAPMKLLIKLVDIYQLNREELVQVLVKVETEYLRKSLGIKSLKK